ncbi:hypothetical protein ACJX0J_029476, partial [Zea mays]
MIELPQGVTKIWTNVDVLVEIGVNEVEDNYLGRVELGVHSFEVQQFMHIYVLYLHNETQQILAVREINLYLLPTWLVLQYSLPNRIQYLFRANFKQHAEMSKLGK